MSWPIPCLLNEVSIDTETDPASVSNGVSLIPNHNNSKALQMYCSGSTNIWKLNRIQEFILTSAVHVFGNVGKIYILRSSNQYSLWSGVWNF